MPNLAEKLERAAKAADSAAYREVDSELMFSAWKLLGLALEALAASHRDRATLDDHQAGLMCKKCTEVPAATGAENGQVRPFPDARLMAATTGYMAPEVRQPQHAVSYEQPRHGVTYDPRASLTIKAERQTYVQPPLYTAAQVQERVEAAVAKEREAVKAEIAKAYKAANPDPFWNDKDRLGASHAEGQRQALRRLEAVLHLAWNSTPPPQARSRGGEG